MTTTIPEPVALHGCQLGAPVVLDDNTLPPTERNLHGLYSTLPGGSPLALGEHGGIGGYEWLPEDAPIAHAFCPSCVIPGEHTKEFDGQEPLVQTTKTAVYGSFECSGPAFPLQEIQRRAGKNLIDGEERRVEREFIASLRTPATIDLTPLSGPVPLSVALTILGNYVGEFWSARPTLHAPAGTINEFATDHLLDSSWSSYTARTPAGWAIAFGGGYDDQSPTGVPAPERHAWLYATGSVRLWRDDVLDVSAVNTFDNTLQAIAERTVVFGHELGSLAIEVVF